MKNKRGIVKLIISMVIIPILWSVLSKNVFANEKLVSVIQANQQDVSGSNELILQLQLKFPDKSKNLINSYKATLEYDENVFETVRHGDFIYENGWSNLEYNQKNHQFVLINKVGTKEDGAVVSIKLRRKENAKEGTTIVKVKEIVSSDGKEDINTNEPSVTLNVKAKEEGIVINPNEDTSNDIVTDEIKENLSKEDSSEKDKEKEEPGNTNQSKDGGKEETSNTNEGKDEENLETSTDNQIKDDVLEEGIKKSDNKTIKVIIIITVILVLILLIITSKKFNKKIKRKHKMLLIMIISGTLLLELMGTVYAAAYTFVSKGEVSGDKKIDYTDVSMLQKHLIKLIALPEEALKKADMNNDGKITVSDLTLQVRKVENKLEYTVDIFESEAQNFYPNKNEEFDLRFYGNVSYGEKIKAAVINGVEYEVNQVENSVNEYEVNINSGEKAGIKEFHFTEALLGNNQRIKVDYKIKLDILKELPVIENYEVTDDIDNSKLKVKFNLTDKDNSITGARYEVLDDKTQIIEEGNLQVGENIIEVPVEETKVYKLHILLNYDLDTNELIQEKDNTGLLQEMKELALILDYNFNISNLKTYKDGKEITVFEKNEEITLRFDSTNSTSFYPEKIKVNGEQYNVSKNANRYEAKINGLSNIGNQEIIIEEVILNNGKVFEVNPKQNAKVEIIKVKPTVDNFKVEENVKDSKLKVELSIKDEDDTIKNTKVVLLDSSKNEIGSKEITDKNAMIEFDTVFTDNYTIKVITDYNLSKDGTGHEYTNEVIHEENIAAKPRVEIKEASVSKLYPEKGEEVTVAYKINVNRKEEPAKVILNGDEYRFTKSEDGKYSIKTTVGDKAGIVNLEATKLILVDGTEIEISNTVKVDVLKSKPYLNNYSIKDKINDKKVSISFDLKDPDNSFEQGKAELIKKEDNTKVEKDIKVGKNTVEFSVEELKLYDFNVLVSYDLDSNILENESVDLNKYKDEEIFKVEVEQIIDYNLNISDIKTYKDQTASKYFEKNKGITLEFTSTNVTKFYPVKALINGKEYDLTKTQDTYKTTIDGYSDSGVKNIKIEKLILDNKKELEVSKDNQVSIDVLKDKLSIENYNIVDDIKSGNVTITFDVNDPDKSFKEGKAELIKEEDQSKIEEAIKPGKNTLKFSVEELKSYDFNVLVTYDLDSNSLSNESEDINKFENEKVFTAKVKQIIDYQLEVSDIKTYKEQTLSKYFEKNEEITVDFKSTNVTNFYPVKAFINEKEYEVIKSQDTYKVKVDSYSDYGVKDITIKKLVLDNGKELELSKNNQVQVEILKDKPTVSDFGYKERDDNKIEVSLKVVDSDSTITNSNVIITDENGKEVKTEKLTIGENKFTFDQNDSEKYTAKVLVDYDLGTSGNGDNKHTNESLLSEEINIADRIFEIKDIENVYLYKQNGSSVDLVTNLNISDLSNLKEYIVKLEMKDMQDLYTEIKEFKVEDDILKFVLDYDNVVQYDGEQKYNKLEVSYGQVVNNTVTYQTIETLIEDIKNDPNGTFTLTRDLNAMDIGNGETLIDNNIVFTGTLNGNGYKIYNLTKPIFNKISGGTIENLVIENATINTPGKGAIANEISNTVIRNVHAKNIKLTVRTANSGTLVGRMNSSSRIEECSITEMNIDSNSNGTGGIVGWVEDSDVYNSYVKGKITNTQDHTGGVFGTARNVTISNTYSEVIFNTPKGPANNAAFVGNSRNLITPINSLSLSTGEKANTFVGTGDAQITNKSKNNYELEGTTLTSNASYKGISSVSEEEIKKSNFYKNTLKWDETIWDYSDVENGRRPTLRKADPNYVDNKEEEPKNKNVYIPNYSNLKKLSNYDESKEIAYNNLYKLMPFYDSKYLLVDGNKIDKQHILNTKLIKGIVPFDSNGKMIVGLTNNQKETIDKIKIVFEDGSLSEYKVAYKNTLNNVANYEITDLKIGYNYNKYLLKENSNVVTNLVNKIKGYTFATDLNKVTTEDEIRIYTENFDQVVRANAEEFVKNLLTNVSKYNVYLDNTVLENKIIQDIAKDDKLEKMLVAYNYFDRFYSINIGGVNVKNVLFFDGSIFEGDLNPIKVTDVFLIAKSSERETKNTVEYYKNNIRQYTNFETIADLLEYFIKNFAGYSDVTRWFPDNFKGLLYEAKADDFGEKIEYRAWNIMKKRQEILLPTITIPTDQMYMISVPNQVLVGTITSYTNNPDDLQEREKIMVRIKEYGDIIGGYYNTIAKVVPNAVERLNSRAHIHHGNRWTLGGVYQEPTVSEDLFMKHFYQVIGRWPAANGSAAYANGTDVYWVVNGMIGVTGTFTHESAHNQDNYLYLGSAGLRKGSDAEFYTDSVFAQRFPDSSMHPNFMFDFNETDEVSNNFTRERVDSTEKLEDFYRKMWETVNTIDYIEAEAFLKLSPEAQSKIGKQLVYDNPDVPAVNIAKNGTWRDVTADEFRKMKLKTVEDLWDNQIAIKVNAVNNGDSLDNVYWYLPHNDDGIATKHVFKRVGFEMISIAGYEEGFVPYMSAKSKNDLEAIRTITKDPTMTWKKYQMNKYEEIKKKIKTNTYFDTDEMIEMFKKNMEIDAELEDQVTNTTRLRRIFYGNLQRRTKDFRLGIYENNPNVVTITNADDFVSKIKENPNGKYVLGADIDLTGKIGENSITDVNFLGILDGNNYTIRGIEMPIFNLVKYSNIYNLKLKDVSISLDSINDVGALTKVMSYSIMKNVHLVNGDISGKDKVGGLSGYTNKSIVEECTVNANVVGAGNSIGLFMGQFDGSRVRNSYSLGSVTGRNDTGGFVGWAANSLIENSFSNANIVGKVLNTSGGFVGQIRGTTKVLNNIAFGNIKYGYKFDGRTANNLFGENYKNNYEFEESAGTSTLDRPEIDFTGKISVLKESEISKEELYKNNLKWDSNIWDFVNVPQGGLPKLKNLDPNNIPTLIEKIEVRTVDDFLKINDKPDGVYKIMNDIDFTGHQVAKSALIANDFTGRIEGDGHTLKNLNNAALFEKFKGSVKDLNIKDFTNDRPRENSVSAFAKETFGATLRNMKFENITLKGVNNVAPVSGMDGRDNANSIFERISVKNVNVDGTGVYVSGFVGRKYGGKVSNSYVQGTVVASGTETAGLIGATHQNILVENVYVDVNFTRRKNNDTRYMNGGFIGNVYNAPTIKNSISVGDTNGFEAIEISKFIGISEDLINKYLINCYESESSLGKTSVTANTTNSLKAANTQELKDKNFYRDVLKFDETIWNLDTVTTLGYPTLK